MGSFYIFDLDGTLADNKHRKHLIPDWDAFFDACLRDTVIQPVADVLDALADNPYNRIEIWSGRSARVEVQTRHWLDSAGIDPKHLRRMRAVGDHQPDHVLKWSWLNEVRAEGRHPTVVFDDRQSVVDMWRANGVTCFQVAPGEF